MILFDQISTGLDSATTYSVTKSLGDACHALQRTFLICLLQVPTCLPMPACSRTRLHWPLAQHNLHCPRLLGFAGREAALACFFHSFTFLSVSVDCLHVVPAMRRGDEVMR